MSKYKLMAALTGDRRFEEAVQDLLIDRGVGMCEILDRVKNKGREEGKREGFMQGKLEGMTQFYYTEMYYSADQIAQKLDVPADRIQELIGQIVNESEKKKDKADRKEIYPCHL